MHLWTTAAKLNNHVLQDFVTDWRLITSCWATQASDSYLTSLPLYLSLALSKLMTIAQRFMLSSPITILGQQTWELLSTKKYLHQEPSANKRPWWRSSRKMFWLRFPSPHYLSPFEFNLIYPSRWIFIGVFTFTRAYKVASNTISEISEMAGFPIMAQRETFPNRTSYASSSRSELFRR